jgi:hypothetical protein
MAKPQSLSEWADYIESLSGQRLFSQAVAANTHSFARQLVAEGATMKDVEQVMLLFVRQLKATGTKVPRGAGAWDLLLMAQTDARQTPVMSEEEAAMLDSLHKSGPDEMDDFELEAEFEG